MKKDLRKFYTYKLLGDYYITDDQGVISYTTHFLTINRGHCIFRKL